MKSPLVRNLLAAIAGFVSMAALLFLSFAVAWMILGADGAFRGASWEVAAGWIAASIVLGLLAAVVGGFVCGRLAGSGQATAILVGIILVMSVASATSIEPAPPGPRPAEVTMSEAMSSGRQPTWLLWLNPVLGVAGAIVGASLGRRPEETTV